MLRVVPARFVIRSSLLAGALVLSSGLAAQSLSATGSIFGQVVDATTGQPIPGAVVLLNDIRPNLIGLPPVDEREQMPNGARPPEREITTSAGRFVFHNLPKSIYGLEAAASGYIGGSYGTTRAGGPGRSIDLDDGAHMANAIIRLWKCASLSGRVTDDAGEPAIGVQVQATRVSVEGLRRTILGTTQAYTDDRGEYRIHSLAPGNYLVAVPFTISTVPISLADAVGDMRTQAAYDRTRELDLSGGPYWYRSVQRGARVGDVEVSLPHSPRPPIASAADSNVLLANRTVFFPAAVTSTDATVFTLAPGQDQAGIDFQLRASPAVRVSGTATGPAGPARNLGLHLIAMTPQGNLEPIETAAAATSDTGAFTFVGVPSGQYLLQMYRVPRELNVDDHQPPKERPLFAQEALSVGDRDIQGLAVTLREGARVSGRVVFEGAGALSSSKWPPQARIALVDVATASSSAAVWASDDGAFVTSGSAPGRYVIEANRGGWTFLFATLNGRDIDDAPIDLQTTDLDGVVVTFTNQPTHVTGVVRSSNGASAPDIDATVVAFPANYTAWMQHGMAQRRLRILPARRTGAFAVDGLPPGDYIIAAVHGEALNQPHTPAFFDGLARTGTRVSLSAGQSTAIDLLAQQIR